MTELKLCASDYKFMCLVWDNEPINSTRLAKLSEEVLGWKKSTTYTMIKKLSGKKFLKNEESIVSSVIPKSEVQEFESNYIVDNAFGGSLPAFIAAFVKSNSLSEKDKNEIRDLLDSKTEEQ